MTQLPHPIGVMPISTRGSLLDGHTDDEVNHVFGQIEHATGITVVCVWDYSDGGEPDGHSQFYRRAPDGGLFEIAGPLWDWLTSSPDTVVTLPDVGEWFAAVAESYVVTDLQYHDGAHNYAHREA